MGGAMRVVLALAILATSSVAAAQSGPTPLFASDTPIRIKVQGPIGSISRNMARSTDPQPATLILSAPAETHPIQLSARGLSRRTGGICDFPPLRVELMQKAGEASLFAKQHRLKLVTHCKSSAGHQQYLLLEYAAYPMFNVLTPLSFKARLATVDYAEPSGKVSTTRWGFFIEDEGDVRKRNGLGKAAVGARISASQLEPMQAARVALFEYMIGNLDWSMRAGPAGEECCHNSKLQAGQGNQLVPIPYDWDYSGFVDAPYAVPPKQIRVRSVRQRYYQGYCRHNTQVLAAAAEMRAKRGAMEAALSAVPGLEDRSKRKALAFMAGFYEQIATDQAVRANVLKGCLGG